MTARIAPALLALLAVAGCREGARNRPDAGSPEPIIGGNVAISLTDAPYPYDFFTSIVVHLDRVDLIPARGALPPPLGPGSAAFVLRGAFAPVDVLPLTDGKTGTVLTAFAPLGVYDSFRVRFSRADVTLADGRTLALPVAPGADAEFALSGAFLVLPQLTVGNTIDIDIARSFLVSPSGATTATAVVDVAFVPTVRLVRGDGGAVRGRVLDDAGTPDPADDVPVARASVSTIVAGESTSTATNVEGRYLLGGLPADVYEVTAESAGFLVATATAQVDVGRETEVIFRLAR